MSFTLLLPSLSMMVIIMYTLIVALIFSLAFTYFATQNTGTVSLHFANTYFVGVPLYWIVFAALFVGVLVAAIISVVESLSFNTKKEYKKDTSPTSAHIGNTNREINSLSARIRQLEQENAHLSQELEKESEQKTYYSPQPTILERLRTRISTS